MSTSQTYISISRLAAADLSAAQYKCLKFDTTAAASKAALVASASDRVDAILQNDPVADQPAQCAILGVPKAMYGGTVTSGDKLRSDSSGRLVTASAVDIQAGRSVAIALESGAVNEIHPVLLTLGNDQGQEATTVDTVTSGAISVATRTTFLSVTGTQAYTLAAGTFEGQRKSIRCTVAASTPAGTITLTMPTGTTLAFNAVEDFVELEYHATGGWHVVTNISVTIA